MALAEYTGPFVSHAARVTSGVLATKALEAGYANVERTFRGQVLAERDGWMHLLKYDSANDAIAVIDGQRLRHA